MEISELLAAAKMEGPARGDAALPVVRDMPFVDERERERNLHPGMLRIVERDAWDAGQPADMGDGDAAEPDHHVRPELPRDPPQPPVALQQLEAQPQPALAGGVIGCVFDAELVEQGDEDILVPADDADFRARLTQRDHAMMEEQGVRGMYQVK